MLSYVLEGLANVLLTTASLGKLMEGSDKERRKQNNFEIVHKRKYLFLNKEEWRQKRTNGCVLKNSNFRNFFYPESRKH